MADEKLYRAAKNGQFKEAKRIFHEHQCSIQMATIGCGEGIDKLKENRNRMSVEQYNDIKRKYEKFFAWCVKRGGCLLFGFKQEEESTPIQIISQFTMLGNDVRFL